MFLRASLHSLLRAISGNLSTLCNGLSLVASAASQEDDWRGNVLI